MEIIDLDLEETDAIGEKARAITLAFTVAYIRGWIPNSSLITLKVWLGLLPAIERNSYSTELALRIAALRIEKEKDLGALLGAAMIMDEIKRIFTIEEQLLILNRLEN